MEKYEGDLKDPAILDAQLVATEVSKVEWTPAEERALVRK